MPIMLKYVYEAFLSAGATEDKASKAAEEMASYDTRLAKIESDLTVLKWMCGTLIVMVMFVLGKIYK